jgi:NTE family protein
VFSRLIFVATVVSALGCATAKVENEPIERPVPGGGYGSKLSETPYAKKLRVVLAFSGGGTRAAALAYGVLKELRETEVRLSGEKTRMLDAVTVISSVSGGSFTSAYYGLYGERIFEDFEERFLRKDIDEHLAFTLLRPLEMLRFMFTRYSRSDMAMDVYDREVFGGATFADLQAAGGPMLTINATDIDVGTIFTFTQIDFDMLCGDLSQMRLSTAVTASSAVPGVFAPVALENRSGTCGIDEPAWIREALADPKKSRRRYHDARAAASYVDPEERPYVFLVDGGVADNIGARRILANVINSGGVFAFSREQRMPIPENVLYVVVNAQAGGRHAWEKRRQLPSIFSVLSSLSSVGIYRYNFETVELLREEAEKWEDEVDRQGGTLRAGVVEVAFDNLPDPKERKSFNEVKTSFNLDDATVDRLIEVGGRLLRESPEFQEFLAPLK